MWLKCRSTRTLAVSETARKLNWTVNDNIHPVLGQDPLIPPQLLQSEIPGVCPSSSILKVIYTQRVMTNILCSCSHRRPTRLSPKADKSPSKLLPSKMTAYSSLLDLAPYTTLQQISNTPTNSSTSPTSSPMTSASSCAPISRSLEQPWAGKVWSMTRR